jgi:two-component system response regulator YesN
MNDLSYQKISLLELSDMLQLSVRQARRLIKQLYNIGFSELFSLTRIAMSKSMICETDLTLESIAEQVGYSYKGFLRAFKKVTGISPAEYRKTVLND